MAHILIVEDEPHIALSLEEDLRRQGHDVQVVADGPAGLRRGREAHWDLILLDVMLPGMDGIDVCAELRRAGVRTPVIMLTARTQEAEKVLGLDSGADDYVTKPFSLRELRARVRAQLRRSAVAGSRAFRIGETEVDLDRAELRTPAGRVELTPIELRLLEALNRNRGLVLSRARLIEAAWGPAISVTDRAVDTHVFNLRRKLEPVPAEPQYLLGVRGLGYRLVDAT